MARNKVRLAICYDFDGTLSPGNMQEYGFFGDLGKAAKNFWTESGDLAKKHNADPILTYMKHMIDKAGIGELKTTKAAFREYGKSVKLHKGVTDWFARINAYGKKADLALEHYIVSSGLREMIEGTAIAKEFKKIYACSFIYDQNDVARWPAVAVNYTTKTQFLFRINKGILDDNDHSQVNAFVPEGERPIPFSRMIYIGDGATDIPCMKLVKDKGGTAIAVYPLRAPRKHAETLKLVEDRRVNYIAPAGYTEGGTLDGIIKAVLDKIAAEARLLALAPPPKVEEPVLCSKCHQAITDASEASRSPQEEIQ